MKSKSYLAMVNAENLRREYDSVMELRRSLRSDASQDADLMETSDFSPAVADEFAWVWESESV
ncbi:MAG: hypothetical protein EBY16_09195 [Gammaproteobacteria bacterium]|nr:hypothetical protein [Gammaproteobacteria bacterium]